MKTLFSLWYIFANAIYTTCKNYSFNDFDSTSKYSPKAIIPEKYNSSAPCVTFEDWITFHYTDRTADIDKSNYSPENFCYGWLTYNITREDFSDMINKNLNAFKNYRKFIPLYLFYAKTSANDMDESCYGYFRNIACYYEFPACKDNEDGTFSVNAICKHICEKYKNKCLDFYFDEYCKRLGTGYCPGNVLISETTGFSVKFLLLLIFLFIL